MPAAPPAAPAVSPATALTGTARGGVTESDAAESPHVPPPGSLAHDPAAARAILEQVAGRWAEYGDELEAHVEEMRRLRRLTREEARRLRGEA